MFTGLSPSQINLIEEYAKSAEIAFLGLDLNDLPVFIMRDRRRTTEPFAIPRWTGVKGAVAPRPPFRWFTEAESDCADPLAHELLTTLPRMLPSSG